MARQTNDDLNDDRAAQLESERERLRSIAPEEEEPEDFEEGDVLEDEDVDDE